LSKEFRDMVHHMMGEVEKCFDDFNIDGERACWRVNPFLWALYCACTGESRALVDDAPTEEECLAYFIEVFSISRAAALLHEKMENGNNVQ